MQSLFFSFPLFQVLLEWKIDYQCWDVFVTCGHENYTRYAIFIEAWLDVPELEESYLNLVVNLISPFCYEVTSQSLLRSYIIRTFIIVLIVIFAVGLFPAVRILQDLIRESYDLNIRTLSRGCILVDLQIFIIKSELVQSNFVHMIFYLRTIILEYYLRPNSLANTLAI